MPFHYPLKNAMETYNYGKNFKADGLEFSLC